MISIGDFAKLEVNRIVEFGAYLEGGQYGEILLPLKYFPEELKEGDEITVFVYTDNENRLIATTLNPLATANQFAFLKVKDITNIGAFLDLGISKDLFVPRSQQVEPMEEGKTYLVYVLYDVKSGRLAGTGYWRGHLFKNRPEIDEGVKVECLVIEETEIGFKTIVEHSYQGFLYKNELYESVKVGQTVKAYLHKIREDNKLDLRMKKSGIEGLEGDTKLLFDRLKAENGFLPIHDKSDPDEIRELLQMSKKSFKRAAGVLYKKKLIAINDDGIELLMFNF